MLTENLHYFLDGNASYEIKKSKKPFVHKTKNFPNQDFFQVPEIPIRSSCVSIPIIVYSKRKYYNAGHLPGINEENNDYSLLYAKIFSEYCGALCKRRIVKVAYSHQHDKKNKCYVQLIVYFDETIGTKVYPGEILFYSKIEEFSDKKCYFIRQKCLRHFSPDSFLRRHKGVSFFFPKIDKEEKEAPDQNETLDDTIKTSCANETTRDEPIIEKNHKIKQNIIKMNNLKGSEKLISTECSGLEQSMISDEEMDIEPYQNSFEWCQPKETIFNKYPLIRIWFHQHCQPEGLRHRKALLLFSYKRNVGKTTFAKKLVGNNIENYYMVRSNSFPKLITKPKLLIFRNLEQLSPIPTETWERILTGNSFYIYDKDGSNILLQWSSHVPCIITTTNLALTKELFNNKSLNTKIIFQEIEEDFHDLLFDREESQESVEYSFSYEIDVELGKK